MTQALPPIRPNRSLVKQPASRSYAVAKRSRHPVILTLTRLRDSVPPPLRAAARRSAKVTGVCFAGLSVVAIVLFAGLYMRLSQGPIALDFLAPTIEKAVNGEIPGARLKIGGAVIRLSENGYGVEFRLKDVSLLDSQQQPVAQAPLASIGLSGPALLSGRLAASQINFIGPKLIASYNEGKGLALSFSETRVGAARRDAPSSAGGKASVISKGDDIPRSVDPPPDLSAQGQINIVQVLGALFDRTREQGSATAYLTEFGIKDAVFYFDHGDRLSRWDVSEASVRLSHLRRRSVISGEVVVAAAAAKPWRLNFRVAQHLRTSGFTLSASISDVVPRSLSDEFVAFPALKYFDLPVTLALTADLSGEGEVGTASISADFGKGDLYAPWQKRFPFAIDKASFRFRYSRERAAIDLLPSYIAWDKSRIELTGAAERVERQAAAALWRFDISSPSIMLGAEEFGLPPIPIDFLGAKGSYDPAAASLALERLHLQAADAFVTISGKIGSSPESGGVALDGVISPMPAAFVKLIWPKFIAYGAREWAGKNVSAGRVLGGSLKVRLTPEMIAMLKREEDVPNDAFVFRMDVSGAVMTHIKGLPPIRTGRTKATVNGRRFIFDMAEPGVLALPSGAQIVINSGQFITADFRPRVPYGEVHFQAEGEAAAVAELLDLDPLGYLRKADIKPRSVGGKVSASFSIGMPLAKELKFNDLSIRGKVRHDDVRMTGMEGGLGVHGGVVNFDVTEKALEAQGEVRVNGVPVQLAWQRIFDAPAELQPRLRLRARLNERAREEFGLPGGNVLKGDVPLDVQVGMRQNAPPLILVEADLTNVDLNLSSFGWRKPPGQRAILSFDVEKQPSGSSRLNNFRVTGLDLAIVGWIALDAQRRPSAFEFPVFSYNIQTKLEIKGALSQHNVWKIDVRGSSYNGQTFFRSLFSPGQLAASQIASSKSDPGVDLHAEIASVVGYFDTTLRNVVIDAKKRGGALVALEATGRLNGVSPIAIRMEGKAGQPRILVAEATDAGAAFRLVGFYPAVRGGEASLRVNLDGDGEAEKQGTLYAENFVVVGDQVVEQVVQAPVQQGKGQPRPRGNRREASAQGEFPAQQIQFDRMTVRFAVGHGQFVLQDSAINGPLLGATIRGRIDFERDTINLSGTYVPLYGLNAPFAGVPLISDLLQSRPGEGIFGITFGVQGPASKPNVIVNPVSIITPGFLRQIMEFDHTPPRVIPRPAAPPAEASPKASSQPPVQRE